MEGGNAATACIHQLVEARAQQTPERIAAVCADQHLSYGELQRRAHRLACFLQTLGVGPDVCVALYLERSLQALVGMLGILKAGGAYLPLDPAAPCERQRAIVEDCGAAFILTQEQFIAALPDSSARVICLDAACSAMVDGGEDTLVSEVQPDHLAYVIYTSGTTGRPKGVMIPHSALVLQSLAVAHRYQLACSDRVLQFASLSFDVAVEEIFPSWLCGSTCLLLSDQARISLSMFHRTLESEAATVLNLPASFWHEWVSQSSAAGEPLPAALRLVIVGSERSAPEWLEEWQRRAGETVLFANAYGTTETTITSTVYGPLLCQGAWDTGRVIPIGQPLAHVQIALLAQDLTPVPSGTAGEIYTGGAGLARGYLHAPDLTAERFLPDPFSRRPGARLYRTGDLARVGHDGNLELLGRQDQQVKIRGFRVELAEIEAVLQGHPQVREVVVVCREESGGEPHLCAYLSTVPGPILAAKHLQDYLRAHLPAYMLPARILVLASLPRTAGGKVDRQALLRPVARGTGRQTLMDGTATETEQQVGAIWAEVLGIAQLERTDTFFDLGGHSLAAIRIISRIRSAFQVELSWRHFFEAPALRELAALVDREKQRAAPSALPVFTRGARREPLPLTFAQEQVWFLQQLDSGSVAYTAPSLFRLRGHLDQAAMEQSLNELVRRHEILRTTFPASDGQPYQAIHPAQPVQCPLVDLTLLGEQERLVVAEHLVHEELRQAFDLTRLPLLRWRFLRLATREHILVLVEHHLLHDGWSTNVLIQDVFALYRAYSAGRRPELAPPSLQLADFACWQRYHLQGELLERHQAFWQRTLRASPPLLALPTDRPRPALPSFRGASLRMQLPPELCQKLQAGSLQHAVTPFMTLLACFLVLLHRYSRQDHLVIGTGMANRRWQETETMLGMIIQTVVFYAHASGDPAFHDFLGQVRETLLEVGEHHDLPFHQIVAAVRPERNLSYNPLFQVFFGIHDAPPPDLTLQDLCVSLLEAPANGSARFDLGVIVIPRPERENGWQPQLGSEGVTLIWEYSTDLFDAATISRMMAHYQILLAACLAQPEQRLSALPLLSAAEQEQVLVTWNATRRPYPEQCLALLLEAQVARTPAALAATFDREHLTYAALDRRANRIARRLQQLGVGPEVLVGVCLQRSLELLVGLLAIVKAGGGYLPLDPAYPAERLAFLLQDAHVRVLLTQPSLREQFACLPGAEGYEILSLTLEDSACPTDEPDVLRRDGSGENLAYVLYTSGSTGQPKGVQVTQRSLVNLLTAMQAKPGLGPQDTLLAVTSLSFDIAGLEIWLPLLVGARVVIAEKAATSDGSALGRLLNEEGVTFLQATPLTWRLLLESGWRSQQKMCALCGGEALPLDLARRILPTISSLWNMYGPTETTIWSTACQIQPGQESVSIGRPLANTRIFLLDSHMQPGAVGVPGELYIGGDGLARGYLCRPDLTAGRFLPNPWGATPGERLYRTGDLARFLPDGTLEFLGRSDQQVKVRGVRIEPGEIEAVLSQHPAVSDVHVLARGQEPEERQLIAYVVSTYSQACLAGELRAYLATKLPHSLIPSAFLVLQALPRTAHGKLDRSALPPPEAVSGQGPQEYVAPRDLIELHLTQLFAALSGTSVVGVTQSFFDLGGHSLAAARLMAAINKAFARDLPLATLFQAQTVEALAAMVRGQTSLISTSPLVAIQPQGSRPPFYCVHPIGGEVLCFLPLARLLGTDQPFFALQETRLTTPQSIAAYAQEYVQVVRAHQAQGPYLLGGYSTGGLIAFEMALQLQQQGEQVSLLALLDTTLPVLQAEKACLDGEALLCQTILEWIDHLQSLEPAPEQAPLAPVPWETLRAQSLAEQVGYYVTQARHLGSEAPDLQPAEILRYLWDTLAIRRAISRYLPGGQFRGAIHYFRTPDNERYGAWDALCTIPLVVHQVAGTHNTLLEEQHLPALAEELHRCMRADE